VAIPPARPGRPGQPGRLGPAPIESEADALVRAKREKEQLGLEVKSFTCRRGDVFIWHSGLLHGGQKRTDPSSTRKSFVTHYSSAATFRRRSLTMRWRQPGQTGDEWTAKRFVTDQRFELDGRTGLENPVKGWTGPS